MVPFRALSLTHKNLFIMTKLVGRLMRLDKDGGLTNHKKTVDSLPIGCILTYFASFGHEYTGWVVSEKDSNGYQDIIYESVDGYTTHHIQLASTEPVSEKFGIGIYYNDEMKCISETEVEELKLKLIEDDNRREVEALEKELKDEETRKNLISKFDYLTVLDGDSYYDPNEAKKNLVKMLKKRFPETKFSVRKSSYNSYNIRWTDGAPSREVDAVAKMFNGYEFDYTGDYYDSSPEIFNRLFGNIKFIFTNRSYSGKVTKIKNEIEEYLIENGNEFDSGVDSSRIFHTLVRDINLNKVTLGGVTLPSKENWDIDRLYKLETTEI